ncbi:MAG: glycine cleavage system protein GcvH [Caldisericia bacterium]|nr:glycine cleavage system protein GcvH [Caldisericia bacterium]MDD4615249.1 glycine cleavage system protein GcvH [Caldisericia bacterium]
MSKIREDLFYTHTDEWVKVDDGIATIGLTDYAQEHLGDIVYVEPCDEDQDVKKEDVLTTVESVKSASDIYSPVSGKIISFNSEVEEESSIINKEPYDGGWICKIELSSEEEIKELMTAEEYKAAKED